MREFAKVSPEFWINERGRAIKKLGIEAHHLAFYLLTNPHSNMIGIYYLPIPMIAHEINLSYEHATKAIEDLISINYCSYDSFYEYIWVHDMAIEQIAPELKPNDNRVKGVNFVYQKLPNLSFLPAFFEKYHKIFYLQDTIFATFSKPLISKEKDKENEIEKEKEKKTSLSGKPDVVSFISEQNQVKQKNESFKSQALEILEFLNEKTGKKFRPVDTNLKLIMARLKSGVTVIDCRQVIAKKNREWKGDPKMFEWLRPKTLFNVDNFEQYIGELVIPKEGAQHDKQ